MFPREISPTSVGCIVRLVQRGERGALTSTINGQTIATIGCVKPGIWTAVVWINGRVFENRGIWSDIIGRPPTIEELLLSMKTRPERWLLLPVTVKPSA
jgi:hypothetical protein